MISQHWFRLWLGAVRQQAITWANVDPVLWRHMASLGPDELSSDDTVQFTRPQWLNHWGQATDICVSRVTIIGSDNGLSPGRHQAIIWTTVGILLIGPLGTNFSEISIEIYTLSFKKMPVKMSSGIWQPFCLGLNVFSRNVVPLGHNMWATISTKRLRILITADGFDSFIWTQSMQCN